MGKYYAKDIKFGTMCDYDLAHDDMIHIRVSDVGDFKNESNYTEFEFNYKNKEYCHVGGRNFTELEQAFVTGFVARYEDILIKFPHVLYKLTVVPEDESTEKNK